MPAIFSDAMEISNRAAAPLGSQHFAFSVLTSVAELVGPSQIS
jgi:hypothetical protein